MHMCDLDIDLDTVVTIFRLDFGNVPTVWYLWFFFMELSNITPTMVNGQAFFLYYNAILITCILYTRKRVDIFSDLVTIITGI